MKDNNEGFQSSYFFELNDLPTGKILETVIIYNPVLAWKHFYNFVEEYSLPEETVDTILQLIKLNQPVIVKDTFNYINIRFPRSFPILSKDELKTLDDPIIRDNKKTASAVKTVPTININDFMNK